jgi:hypothetical protein
VIAGKYELLTLSREGSVGVPSRTLGRFRRPRALKKRFNLQMKLCGENLGKLRATGCGSEDDRTGGSSLHERLGRTARGLLARERSWILKQNVSVLL